MKQWIYLDHAATTPLKSEVQQSMMPYFSEIYGNTSAFSRFSDQARNTVEEARETLAGLLGASPREICFTGGSACAAGSLDPSHVLLALGLPPEAARGSLRLTLSADNTPEEIDDVVDELKKIVADLRDGR